MMRIPQLFLLAAFTLGLGMASLAAQKAPITVDNVKFNSGVSPYDWNNIVIKLRANSNPDPEAANPRYVDNITVRLSVAYEDGANKGKYVAFESEVTIATIEVGKDKTFAFWIPYDIVERGNFGKEPFGWVIELQGDGKKLPMNRDNTSSNITNDAALQSFYTNAVSPTANENEGIMMPYYLSPYGPVDREPPAFIRKEPK